VESREERGVVNKFFEGIFQQSEMGGSDQTIIDVMLSNPCPNYLAAFKIAHGTVVSANPGRIKVAFDSLEADRWVLRIRQPNQIIATCEFLNFAWESVKILPKLRRRA
jgi:hypothetical protein